MKVIYNPQAETWTALCARPQMARELLDPAIRRILGEVRSGGDQALIDLTLEFDGVDLPSVVVTAEEKNRAGSLLDENLKAAMAA